jgi:hypothetical protein
MKVATYAALQQELQKIASGNWGHAAEIAGLGALAVPTVQKMRGKKMSEKNTNRAELGGLGILAAPSAVGLAKHFLKKGSANLALVDSALSLFNKTAAPALSSVMNAGAFTGRAARMMHGAQPAMQAMAKKPKFTMDALKGAYKTQGLKPSLGSAVKLGSIPLGALGGVKAGVQNAAFKGAKGVAGAAGKMMKDPRRAGMLSHFTPPSQINMARAISL